MIDDLSQILQISKVLKEHTINKLTRNNVIFKILIYLKFLQIDTIILKIKQQIPSRRK